MPLTDCQINLTLTWSANCVITNSSGAGTFTITDTKLYVPVVILSFQDNVKQSQHLKSGFKRTIFSGIKPTSRLLNRSMFSGSE